MPPDPHELALALRHETDISRGKSRRQKVRGIPDLKRIERGELDAAVAWAGPGSPLGTLLLFLWVTGARLSEALSVVIGDFNWQASSVRIGTLKRRGEHYRALPLPGRACGALAQYIAANRLQEGEKLWTWVRVHAYTRIRQALQEGAGVPPGRAKPHAIRHGHAFHALAGGAPLPALSAALGHAQLSTTQIYSKATAADLRKAYGGIDW